MPVRKPSVTAICVVACWSLPAFSVENDVDGEALQVQEEVLQVQDNERVEDIQPAWWLDSHESVSETIGHWSTNIDSFLSGNQSHQDSDSHVQIRFGSVLGEDNNTGFFDFSTRLKLPNTQDRLRLVVESEPDSLAPESLRGESSQQDSVVNSALKSSVSAAVRYMKQDIGLDVDAGIRVDFPLDPFLRFRLKQERVTGAWEWWQKQEAFAYYSKGIGARYGLGFAHRVSPTLSYGADAGVTWLDKEGLFYLRENFFIEQVLDEKSRLGYQVSFLQSGAHRIESDSFLYNLQYERLLYKDWLVGQLRPQFTHEADDDFDGVFSLTLSLAIYLGPEYLN
ncbi:hypothetical protein HGG82_06545 [Marinomonas sp. M1K-6]|uniref:DUF3570 domain-containing protein n=1 Tax=Marinomonas profundi TaxID=2726122 RepID=A0A847R4A5_9GAMM|nr:hypothetical protein [Marinomonas profundi]NLQ17283.1 hypothetical protein [Marinomonas profundi]UDV04528.1 hypothetical protein J8N69_07225 [Marinomonas profundi]